MQTLEAIALILAYVAHADAILSPEERHAIADALPELVPGTTPRDLRTRVDPLLIQGKHPELVGKACLLLSHEPLEVRLATLRSALLVARSEQGISPEEHRRIAALAKDLAIPPPELERLLAKRR